MPDATIAGFGQTGIPPIGVNPQDWYNLQRRQALAAGLAQSALSPVQAQNYGPIRSRTGLTSVGNSLASALLGRRLQDKLGPEYARVNQEMMVPFGGAPPPSPDQGSSPPPPAAAPSPGAGPAGGGGPSPSPPAATAPGAGAPPGPGMSPGGGGPLNPLNLPPALAMTMFMRDPGKYGELVAGPESWRSLMLATGGDARAAAQLTLNKAFKEGLVDVRPGGMIVGKNPDGSPFILRNPQLGPGVEPSFGPGWSVEGAHLIPGYLDAEAALTGTTKRAEAENTLHELKTRGGGSAFTFGIPSSIPGAPGGAGAGGAPGAPSGAAPPGAAAPAGPGAPPRYFPAPPSAGPAPGGPPGVQARSADPWQSVPELKVPSGYGAPDEYTEKILEKAADKHVELVDKYGTEADSADQRLAFNNEALKLLQSKQVEVGPLSDRLVKLSKMAAEQGMEPGSGLLSWLPSPEVANNTDELKKFLVRNPLTNLKPTFGGRPAAVEFQVLRTEASPSETMLSNASQALIQIDNKQAQFQKDRAQAYDHYHDMGGNPLRFEQWYSSRFPMSQVLDRPQPGEQPTPQQAAAEIARRAALKRPPASSVP